MTAAVTGATGHIGNNLCKELIKNGFHVKALVRSDRSALEDIRDKTEIIIGDVTDKESLNNLTKDTDIVFHLAAVISIQGNSKKYLQKINVEGTRNIVSASVKNKVKRFIHFSSIHALQQKPLNEILTEKNGLVQKKGHAYDLSKADAERIVLKACKEGLDAVILNPTSVIGVNDFKPSLLGQAIIKIASGKLPALIPGGFDWVDVQDIVQASVNAIDKGKKGERYLLSGHWYDLKQLASEINKHTNNNNPIKIPGFLAKIGLPFIYIYSKITGRSQLYTNESLNILVESNKLISSKKAENDLNYRKTPFPETVKKAVQWYYDNNFIKK